MKMKLIPFLSKAAASKPSRPWPWPAYCNQTKTLSFRAGATVSSDFIIDFPGQEDCGCDGGGEAIETVIRGLRSERLFFEPGETSSILEEGKRDCAAAAAASAAGGGDRDGEGPLLPSLVTMESEDPYDDFKRSMEEMVEAHGLREWECLQELLGCYLRVNSKKNHGYIVGAFVDLLIGLSFAPNNSSSDSSSLSSSSSPLSSSSSSSTSVSTTTPCSSSLEEKPGGGEEKDNGSSISS